MGSFPPAVTQAPPQGASAEQGGGSPAIKLAMLGQLIKGLSAMAPQGQQGIDMMLKGLQMVQASMSAASSPQQPAAPPR